MMPTNEKQTIDFYAEPSVNYLYIVFKLIPHRSSANYLAQAGQIGQEMRRKFPVSGVAPLFDTRHDNPDRPPQNVIDSHGFDRYFRIDLQPATPANLINQMLNFIAQWEWIEIVYPSPQPASAALPYHGADVLSLEENSVRQPRVIKADEPIPDFTPLQYYTFSSAYKVPGFQLGGIGISALATFDGYRGDGITIISHEIDAWSTAHVNLPPERVLVAGAVDIDSHDTKSVGIMAARDVGFGIRGIASRAKVGYSDSPMSDLLSLYNYLYPGDVIQIGIQTTGGSITGCQGPLCYIPMESQQAWFDGISAFTAKGVHVIQAAGNGNVDLDHAAFARKFDRTFRDSGAIIVGAADPAVARRATFSTYGSRVDSCSWGWNVVTTTLFGANADLLNRENASYTRSYSGTSSANPIVAGAVASLSGIAKAYGIALSPLRARNILTQTGTYLTGGDSAIVGTQPDLAQAIYQL